MFFKRHLDRTENLQITRRWQLCLIIALLFIILVLGIELAHVAGNPKVYIVTPYDGEKTLISEVTPKYLTSVAISDAEMFFNYTPANVETKNALFLNRIAPSELGETQVALKQRTKDAVKNDVSQVFYADPDVVIEASHEVTIKGEIHRYIGGKEVNNKETGNVVLKIDYAVHNGLLLIKGWSYS